jgi:hypothetical protein
MNDQQPESDSLSEVRRSSHLFVVTLGERRLGEWAPEPDGTLLARFVELNLELDQTLKGRIDQICGESVAICVRQRGTGSWRVSDDYGVWSKVDLQSGKHLVAFCSSTATDLVELLQPPHCTYLAGEDVLPDLRTCLDLESRHLPTTELWARVAPLLASRTGILARYLWACTGQAALEDRSVFELHMEILERPNTSPEAREVLMMAAYEALSLREAPPPAQLKRLVRAMFVMLTVPEAQRMHENLARVYLPNLIGLSRGHAEVAASMIFAQGSRTKARVHATLVARAALDPDGLLSRWLAEG